MSGFNTSTDPIQIAKQAYEDARQKAADAKSAMLQAKDDLNMIKPNNYIRNASQYFEDKKAAEQELAEKTKLFQQADRHAMHCRAEIGRTEQNIKNASIKQQQQEQSDEILKSVLRQNFFGTDAEFENVFDELRTEFLKQQALERTSATLQAQSEHERNRMKRLGHTI